MAIFGFICLLVGGLFFIWQGVKATGALLVVQQLSGSLTSGLAVVVLILYVLGGVMVWAAFSYAPFQIIAKTVAQ